MVAGVLAGILAAVILGLLIRRWVRRERARKYFHFFISYRVDADAHLAQVCVKINMKER